MPGPSQTTHNSYLELHMVEHALWVTTDRFETITPSEDFINPRCFGEDFALWLKPRLAERGLRVSDPIQEDWGWVLLVNSAGYKFTITIGVMEDSIGNPTADWRVGVVDERGLNSIRTWFKPAPAETLLSVLQELKAVLTDEPQYKISNEEPDR